MREQGGCTVRDRLIGAGWEMAMLQWGAAGALVVAFALLLTASG